MKNTQKKFIGSALALSFVISSFSQSSEAASKNSITGKSCSVVGALAKSGNKNLICKKVNKKLTWQVSSLISKDSKPVTPTATASPTPSSQATEPAKKFTPLIPIQIPIKLTGAITFSNAVEQASQIPRTAWQNIQDVISSNSAVDIPTTLAIGPNTDTTESQIKELLSKAYALWNGFKQPSKYAGLIYNATDEAWAEDEWPKLANTLGSKIDAKQYIPNHLRAGCSFSNGKATECWGGMALTFPDTDLGFAFYGVQSPFWSKGSLQTGPISQVTHEYTHNVQFAQVIGSPLDGKNVFRPAASHSTMPCWFSEGQANAIGIPIVSGDLNSYMQGRDNSVFRRINTNVAVKPTLSTLSADAITNFLYSQDISTCYDPNKNPDWQLGYNIGFAATEVLVAIGGPQATMALLAKGASGLTWSQSFEAVYGISWKSAAEVIGKVLAAEYAGKQMFS